MCATFFPHFSENSLRGIFRNVAISVLNTRWQHRPHKYGEVLCGGQTWLHLLKTRILPFVLCKAVSFRVCLTWLININKIFKLSPWFWLWGCCVVTRPGPLCVFLQDLMLRHGWRTAAIVPELEQETNVVSTNRYSLNLTWLQALTGLMERLQVGHWSKHLHLQSIRFS